MDQKAKSAWKRFLTPEVVVGILSIVVGTVVAIVLDNRSKTEAELSYSLSPVSKVVSIEGAGNSKARNGVSGRIEILYNGRPVPMVSLVQVRVRNTGNVPLHRALIHDPIFIEFPQGAQILGLAVTDRRPPTLQSALSLAAGNVARLDVDLLNAGEYLDTQFVYTGEAPPAVTARIEGFRVIPAPWAVPVHQNEAIPVWIVAIGVVAVIGLAHVIVKIWRGRRSGMSDGVPIYLIVVLGVLILIGYGLLYLYYAR